MIKLEIGDSVRTPYVEEFEAYARRHRVSLVEAMHAVAAESPALVEQHERFSHAIMDDYDERWLSGRDEVFALRRARAQAEHAAAEKFRAEAAAARPAAGSFESFVADVLRREFDDDMSRYSEAMERAGELYPDARDAYLHGGRASAPAVERFRSAAPAGARPAGRFESLVERIHKSEFGGAPESYSAALHAAGERYPAERDEYIRGPGGGAAAPVSAADSFADMESTLDAAISGARDALASARVALKQSRESRNRESLEGSALTYAATEKALHEGFAAEVTPADTPLDEPPLIRFARLILKSKLGNNLSRWPQAVSMAAEARPDLARQFCGVVA